MLISGDNQGSIFITSNPITKKWSKHIDIHSHFIFEKITDSIVKGFFINGENNPTDLLTKNLGVVKFIEFRSEYGPKFSSMPL
jgi:hypothetical protein